MTNFSVFLEEDPGSAAWIQFPESGDLSVTSQAPPQPRDVTDPDP